MHKPPYMVSTEKYSIIFECRHTKKYHVKISLTVQFDSIKACASSSVSCQRRFDAASIFPGLVFRAGFGF